MPTKRIKDYLDNNKIKYAVLNHPATYTAQETAQSAHVSGKDMAKTVIVKMDGQTAMVVLPASYKINLGFLQEITGSEDIRLATEEEFRNIFPDCEMGAMPPLGNLYSVDVYVARRLVEDEEIAFNAGNHRELIKMKYKDYDRLVRPLIFDLTYEPFKAID
ncbi:MAG: YbaK/EbsC family protein [Candidatus Omnitrophica bacterium]|nr:YbaK/EbsC family protein [Candidatus Omnitrophota bacterium]